MYIPMQTIILKTKNTYLKIMFEKINDNNFRCYYSLKKENKDNYEPFIYKHTEKNILNLLTYVKEDFLNKYKKIDEVYVYNLGIFTIKNLMEVFNISIGRNLDYDSEIHILLTDKKGNVKTHFLPSGLHLELKNALKEKHYLIKIQTIE